MSIDLIHSIISHFKLSATKAKIAQNLFWAIFGKVVNLLGGLIVGIVVARYLGPAQYGLMNYVISYVFLFQTLALFGLDSIEIREESKVDISFETVIGTAFVLKCVLGVVFMIVTIATSLLMETDRNTILLISVYSITIILNSFTVIRNHFTAIVQNKEVVKTENSRVVIGIVIKLILLYLKADLIWFVVASAFDFVLLASGYCMFYQKVIGKISSWKYDGKLAKFLLKESFPLMLTNAAVIVYQRIDQVMIGQMIDKRSVGFFVVASKFVEILIYIPMIFSQTIMPILVKIRKQDIGSYQLKSQQFMNISLWLSLFCSILMSISAYWVVLLTFGKQYMPAVAILQTMSFKAASVALSNTAGTMLIVEGLQKYAFYRDIMGCITCVLLNYIFLPIYGIMAAAVISIVSNVVAGYLADAIIPSYRHLFVQQSKAFWIGWRDVLSLKSLLSSKMK